MSDIGRKHPVHQPLHEAHNTPIIVFLTVCTKDRKKILTSDAVHGLLLEAWSCASSWLVGRYVILPDHVHLFCAPAELHPKSLLPWVSFWKSYAARHWPKSFETPVWERHFWDTQLRRYESYDEKWNYVIQNPVRHNLITEAEDWPFQGEMHVLSW